MNWDVPIWKGKPSEMGRREYILSNNEPIWLMNNSSNQKEITTKLIQGGKTTEHTYKSEEEIQIDKRRRKKNQPASFISSIPIYTMNMQGLSHVAYQTTLKFPSERHSNSRSGSCQRSLYDEREVEESGHRDE